MDSMIFRKKQNIDIFKTNASIKSQIHEFSKSAIFFRKKNSRIFFENLFLQ